MRGTEGEQAHSRKALSCAVPRTGPGVHGDLVSPDLLYPIGCSMFKFCGSYSLARIRVSKMSLGALLPRVMRLGPEIAFVLELRWGHERIIWRTSEVSSIFHPAEYFTLST